MAETQNENFQVLDSDHLGDIMGTHDRVLVFYGAGWCGNCRMIKPKVKKLAQSKPDVHFVYVDAEAYPESRSYAKVSNLPTFAYFKGGELINQSEGNKIQVVEELINETANN